MAVIQTNTLEPCASASESLANALWFLQHRRFVMALEALRNALAFCEDERRFRIAILVSKLEGASVASLMGA